MKITSSKTIIDSIVGANGAKDSIRFNGRHYAYKTKGGRYYLWNSWTGTKHRIAKCVYEDFR